MSGSNTSSQSWWEWLQGQSLSPSAATQQQALAQAQTTSAYSWSSYANGTYPAGIGQGSLAQYTAQYTAQYAAQYAGLTVGWSIPVLSPDIAAELLTQFEDDRTLLDDKGRLKFGKYRHKRLCKADLEYLVALGRAINKVRQGIAKDLRARRALARITQ